MVSCKECKAECCRYVTTIIKAPKYSYDWDEIKWMLLHRGTIVYKDDNEWNVEVKTNCRHIDSKTYKCKIYKTRPQVCKDHKEHECEANDEDFADVIFRKPEDVDEYLKKK